MKFAIFAILLVFAQCQSDVDNDIDTVIGGNISDVAVETKEVNTGVVLNNSNIIVLSNANFGQIVQQLGVFEARAQAELENYEHESRILQEVDNDIDTVIGGNISDIAVETTEVNTAVVLNDSNIVAINNANFGTIVQQVADFAYEADQNISKLAAPENNPVFGGEGSNVENDIKSILGLNISDIAVDTTEVNTGVVLNNSNIVVLDKVNFGKIIQQLGDFQAQTEERRSLQVDNDIDTAIGVNISDIAVETTEVSTGVVLNDSNIITINNANFGSIVQQLGVFSADLGDLVKLAEQI